MNNSYSPYAAPTQLQMLWKKRSPVNFPELYLLLKLGCGEHEESGRKREEEENSFLVGIFTTPQTENDRAINIIHNPVP